METGKLGFVQTAVPEGSVAVTAAHETADRMHVQSPPLAAFYVRAMTGPPQQQQPSLPQQPVMTSQLQPAQAQLPAGIQDAPAIGLPISTLCPKQPLPILTFHITGGVPLTPTKSVGGVVPAGGLACPSKPPKSVGKHVCQYCGRDCLKPSVLEKHLRCHTGERPYPCNVCGISFKTQSNLYKHKRTQAHARISSESDRASLSSQESLHSSRDTCFSSSLSLEAQSHDSGSQEGNEVVFTPPSLTTTESGTTQTHSNQGNTQGSGTVQALQQAALVGLIAAPMEVQKEVLTTKVQQVEPPCGAGVATAGRDSKRTAGGGGPRPCSGALMAPNRHLPLQRQEATLSPKPWDSMSMSRGKSQNHDSTDSGFSDSGEHHWSSSPGSSLHDHSMESLTESSMETPEHQPASQMDSDSASAGESRSKVSVQEKRQLEERISKIILKNDALMDDKQLENVRPRKTVLSKQGSIDLPMPYTYKDSFHFEMRSTTTASKQPSVSPGSADRKAAQAFCTSMPSQHTGSPEHAPLTRSSSLPFSVTGQLSDAAATPHSPRRIDSLMLSRRSSMGQLYSVKVGAQSVDQHGPGHRSLVRQVAVDCLPEVSPTERSSLSSLNSDTDCTEAASEPVGRKCRRKRSQKFDYNKWYVYGDGTFRKLYGASSEKELDPSVVKTQKSLATSLEQQHDDSQDIQISQEQDLVADAPAPVSTTNTPLNTMQSTLCTGTVVGQPPVDRPCIDGRPDTGVPSFVLLPGAILKPAGLPPQQTESRVIVGADIFSPKVTSGSSSFEIDSQHAALPSERKKQRTEENVSVAVDNMDTEMKEACVPAYKIGWTDGDVTNGVNQSLAPPKREISRPRIQRQDRLIHPHVTPRQPLQKTHSSPLLSVGRPSELQVSVASNTSTSIITTTTTTTTTTATTNTSLPAKTTFLPKYQLKLPQILATDESNSCRRTAPLIRHSFSSSQIFTTCAPRSGHSDSITSFTTLTQSQPVTPITLIHSQQQSRSNGSVGLNASGLPVPGLTWGSSAGAVGGLMHKSPTPTLAVPYPPRTMGNTNDTSRMTQNQMFTTVTPAFPGQSYVCKTVLAQGQLGSITTPRHNQSVIPAVSDNQTILHGKLSLEHHSTSLTDISGIGTPVVGQLHIQHAATVTDADFGQRQNSLSTTVFSTGGVNKTVTGVTLTQTSALAAVRCHIQQASPVASSLYQKTPATCTPTTVYSINQPVRGVALNQTAVPATIQYHIQKAVSSSDLRNNISAKQNTMFSTKQLSKPARELLLSQPGTPVTMQYQMQQVTPVISLPQNLLVTPTTLFCPSQPVKTLANMSLNQAAQVAAQHQAQDDIPATPAKLVYNSQVGKPVREGPFSQTSSPVMVQYHLQQLTGLAQNHLASPVTVIGSQPIKQVTDMALQQLPTPATVHVIQQATPITALSQKSAPTPFTSSLSQTINHVTDSAMKQAGKPTGAQHDIQQPTSVCHTQLATPVTVVPHHQPPTAVSVTSQHQPAIPSTGLENNQTPVPANGLPISQPATPQEGVLENIQTSAATSAAGQEPPQAAAGPVQGGVSIGMMAPPQPTTMPCPRSPSLYSQTGIPTEAGSATPAIPVPKGNVQGGNIVRLNAVPQAPAQDTFIMTTPDLQIVMQLISDEQLALIAPQIDTGDYKSGAGCSVITGTTQASQIETKAQRLCTSVSQDVGVNVLRTNNRSNGTYSTPECATLTTIVSTNGSVMAQPGWSIASISTAKSPTPASVLINTNASQTERSGQSQAPVVLDTSQSSCKVDENSTETGQFVGVGINQKSRVGQGDCFPNQLTVSEKSSRTEHGFMEAHILVHNQQSSVQSASATFHNPTMQSCISKVPGTYQHSSLSASQSSVKTEQTYHRTIPTVQQGGHLLGVCARSGVSVGRARASGLKTQPPPISACHTSPPAAHHPSVSNLPTLVERKGSSRSVLQPGAVPCPPPDARDTTATTETNPHRCELDVLSKAQAPGTEGQLTQTISASTEIAISKQALLQPPDGLLGVPLPQPSGSLQILGGPAGLSQPNVSSAVLGCVEKNSLPASSLVGLVSASYAGQHKLSPGTCTAVVQVNGAGDVTCPAVSQCEPLGPKDTREVCYHTPLSHSLAVDACSPGRTPGDPQQPQQAMGQTERDQPSPSGCREEVSGAGGALEQDQEQGDTRNIDMERTPRHEETSCSSSVKADKGPGDGHSCQSPLPLGLGALERPQGAPDEHRCRAATMEDGGQTNRKEHSNRWPPTGQAGSSGGGGGHIACGANERMLSTQTDPTTKECNIRQEETGSHEPIWTLVAPPPPSPPPPPPPQSHESPGTLLNLNLQLDTDSSCGTTPLRPPSHPSGSSSSSSSHPTSSTSDQSRTHSQTSDHSHPQPLAQHTGPPAHSACVNATRCYQEPGEASVTSLEMGAAPPPPLPPLPPPPLPGPLHGDPLLHSPPETANHSTAERRAHVVLGGEPSSSSSSSSTGCLGSHSGEAACEAWGSQPPRLSAQAQISVMQGDRGNSPSHAPAPHRTLPRAAKARTDVVGSLSWSLRGARKCMEAEEDNSSSSDDEGKLVIEFESN